MRKSVVAAVALASFAAGVGYAAKVQGPGMALVAGKPANDAGVAALAEAERLAGSGSWEQIAVARVYYLSGNKEKGQALIDKVMSGKSEGSDWFRIGRIYAEAGETAKAQEFFNKALSENPKDDSGQIEVGAWLIRNGQRAQGEELLSKAFARNSNELWHYLHTAEAYLNVKRD